MAAPVVTAEVVLDAIKARLDLIVGGANYNTNPSKAIGAPRGPIAEGVGEQLYLEHVECATNYEAAAAPHAERATYHIWCVSTDTVDGQRRALRLARDVQKAVRSGFPAIEAAGATHGVALDGYARDPQAEERAGATVYSFRLTADWVVDLTA